MPTRDRLTPAPGRVIKSSAGMVLDQFDRALIAILRRMTGAADRGHLHVTLPSGRSATIGGRMPGADAHIAINSYGALASLLARGTNGFAESYIEGDVACEDLASLFEFYLDNAKALAATDYGILGGSWSDRLFHRRRRNTRSGSRRNIAAHYDLGNAFYKLWLDPTMTYSSGLFADPAMSLEDSQIEKNRRILDSAGIAPGQALLEIGCGWGAFALSAAERGALVTAITISRSQFEEATARIAAAGLAHQVDVAFQDYRDTRGSFDHIVSVEMIEAVGEENWSTYFDIVSKRLRPGGTAIIQAITVRDDLYDAYRRNPDFIQRYIFPGGMLPTVSAMRADAGTAGLKFEAVETFGQSYARTLALWRERFVAAWPQIAALGFDERFRRMWLYYLAYCEAGFMRGTIDVGLYRFTKL